MPKNHKHDFYYPNDPTKGYWNNFSLEEFGHYWDLPNLDSAKDVFLKEINFGEMGSEDKDAFPKKPNFRELLAEDYQKSNVKMGRNYTFLENASGLLGLCTTYLLYLAF